MKKGTDLLLHIKNIGSISRPFFNKHGAAYVQGVTDETLLNFRNSDLPNYIRLHTAGLESDYMLARQMESRMVFNRRYSRLLFFDHFVRRFGLFNYYAYGLIKYDFDHREETDELKRDIVGHDVYGAVRHLHRPDMEFFRYTLFDDLTAEEQKMVRRAGWRSFLNLGSPLLIGKNGFQISPDLAFNFSLGYTMSPFGDFIDQNIWFKLRKSQVYNVYFRQHQNKNNWFPAGGFSVYDIAWDARGRFLTDLNLHIWQQPKDFSFTQKTGFWGGAVDGIIRYKFLSNVNNNQQFLSFDLGIVAKTKGFMPEEMHMKKHIGLRLGFSLYY